jgi:hypothetical protein
MVVDTFDADVVVAHLGAGGGGAITVEHHPADGIQRSQQPRHAFFEKD